MIRDDFFSLLKRNDFEVKDESFEMKEICNVCYNREISSNFQSSILINYLKYPYRPEVESVLRTACSPEETLIFLQEIEKCGKVIVKKLQ